MLWKWGGENSEIRRDVNGLNEEGIQSTGKNFRSSKFHELEETSVDSIKREERSCV